ncbi:hypothetical protein Tco_0057880 [Tanacetum coccineum]
MSTSNNSNQQTLADSGANERPPMLEKGNYIPWESSLKALDEDFSSKNYVRKFLRDLHPKWRAKETTIEESKDLSSLALDELIGNLKVHDVVIKKILKSIEAKRKDHTRMIDTRPYGTTAYNYTRYPDILPYVYTRGHSTPRFSTLPPPLSSYPTSRRTARMSDDPESPPPSPLSPYLFDLGLVEGIVLVLEYVVGWWMLGNWGVGEDLVVDIGGGGIGAIRWGLRGVVKGMEGLGGLEGVDVEIYARDAQEEASEMRLEALDNVVQQICPEALAAAAMTHATSTQEETNLRSNTSQNKACTYNEFHAVMQGNFRSTEGAVGLN